MFQLELGSDDFYRDSNFVKIGAVVGAIARVLLSNGSANRFQAERDAWPYIHTGKRIAIEGDGSADDATCKSYGARP